MRLWPRRSTAPAAVPSPAEELAGAIERIDDLVAVISPTGEARWWNHAAGELLVRDGAEGAVPVQELLLGGARRATQLSWMVEQGATWTDEQVLVSPDGCEIPVQLTIVPRMGTDSTPAAYAVFARDLRPQHAREAELARRALSDELTGVANATLLGSRLELAMKRLENSARSSALLLLDIDGLRVVNDTVGRDAGDALLREVAERLAGRIRSTDTLARSGGSEFSLLVEDRPDLRSVVRLAHDLAERVREPFTVEGGTIIPRASVGVVRMDASDGLAAVLRRADLALQHAKIAGGDEIVIDDGGVLLSAKGRYGLDAALRETLAGTTIPLHFQPAVDLRSGDAVLAEALLRVTHPAVGAVAPIDVVATATELGLLGELTRTTLHAAMTAATGWDADVGVVVNVSAGQLLGDGLPGAVDAALADTGTAPHQLVLDVAESTYLADPEGTVAALAVLRDRGIRIALDGLGEGWPSLSTLRALDVDIIKIDQALLAEADASRQASAVLGAVLGVAEVLGVTAVAGGIETDEQLDHARSFGFQLAQGRRIAHPAAAGAFAENSTGDTQRMREPKSTS